MCLRILHSTIEITWSIIGRTTEESCEWKNYIVICCWHLLIASDALLGHQVRTSAAPSRRAILIVDIHHDVIIGTLLHGIVKPGSPLLRTNLNKTKLDTADAPLSVKRQYLIKFLIQGSLVHIHPNSNALALGICTKLSHIEIAGFCHLQSRRTHLHLRTIPACIQFDILQTSIHTEIRTLI